MEGLKPFLSDSVELFYTFYDDLIYSIVDGKTRIFDTRNEVDLIEYDFVHFRFWHKAAEQAAACAEYLKQYGRKFSDSEVAGYRSKSKQSEYFCLAAHSLPVPNTLICSEQHIEQALKQFPRFQFPLIAKDVDASKGRDNYLVKTLLELREVFKKNPGIRFAIQSFIPNKGDYRIWVFNGQAVGGYIVQGAIKKAT